MSFIIVGLGNPGEEYAETRHNTGRIMLENFAKKFSFGPFEEKGKIKALVSEGVVGKEKVLLVEPNNFMNNSGASLTSLVTSEKKAKNLVVIYDDLDLPVGKIKISFNRGDGGHRGLASVIKNLKTEAFVRIRVGISPVTPSGKLKKPLGEDAVKDYILGKFKKAELEQISKVSKVISEAIEAVINEGYEKAMGEYN